MKLENKPKQIITNLPKISIKQQQSLKVLEMNSEQIIKLIENEVSSNPLLELNDDYVDKSTCDVETIIEFTKYKATLQDDLYAQLHTVLTPYNDSICTYLIESLDNNGYLSQNINEIADLFHVDVDIVEDSLYLIQTFEPTGVGARNLQECLAIQCAEIQTPLYATLMECIEHYLVDIANNKLLELTDKLNVSFDDLKQCIALIRSCNPKPASNYADMASTYSPDIFVDLEEDEIKVQVKDYSNTLKINHDYDDNADLHLFVKEYTKRITSLIELLHKRQSTLFMIVNAIVSIQRDFFMKQGPLNPLTLKDLSEIVGVHESTVSRSISGKFMEFNQQTIPLKSLLCVKLDSGQSNNAIQNRIAELIKQEDKKKPYSDDQLSQLLKKEGMIVSRRTITKYREAMNIPASLKRKSF